MKGTKSIMPERNVSTKASEFVKTWTRCVRMWIIFIFFYKTLSCGDFTHGSWMFHSICVFLGVNFTLSRQFNNRLGLDRLLLHPVYAYSSSCSLCNVVLYTESFEQKGTFYHHMHLDSTFKVIILKVSKKTEPVLDGNYSLNNFQFSKTRNSFFKIISLMSAI